MTRKKFNNDVVHASKRDITHISHIVKGNDDGEVVFTFSHAALSSPLVIRLVTLNIDDYPQNSGFLAYTDDDTTSSGISTVLDDLPQLSRSKSVINTLNLISKKFRTALSLPSEEDSDIEMTDVENEDDQGTDADEEIDYNFSNDIDFGLGPATNHSPQSTGNLNNIKFTTGRFIDDLCRAKDAGFRISLLTNVVDNQSGSMFALSLPISHLGLPIDTLEAWEIEPTDFVVLLCRYDADYPYLEKFVDLPSGHRSSMQFSFGKCTSCKPTITSALTAFSPMFNQFDTCLTKTDTTKTAAFVPIPISNSINAFMNAELSLLLKYRLYFEVSWDRAKQVLQEQTKAGHLQQDSSITFNGSGNDEDEDEDKVMVSTTARPLLNQDYVRSNPNDTGPLPQDQLSMPLIAMQFALRYFVRSTQYCLVCHRKTNQDFAAIKPYVCTEPLCLFQYMALGLGPSIEHDIIARPTVVDLLVSFCAAGLHTSRIREWPKGLAIKVPLFNGLLPPRVTAHRATAPSTPAGNKTPPLGKIEIRPIPVWAQISVGEFTLDRTNAERLKVGDMVVVSKHVTAVSQSSTATTTADVHHCRIKSIRVDNDNVSNRLVQFDCLVSALRRNLSWENVIYHSTGDTSKNEVADVSDIQDTSGQAELYLYEHDLDDLPAEYWSQALQTLLLTIPAIRTLRQYLLSHKGFPLASCSKISKSALSLLRWVVASNRSFIVQLDQDDTIDVDGVKKASDREHEKIQGLDSSWLQFRFAQGSPEKEHRFKQALEHMPSKTHPTIFAWHGSQLDNWHSIIRSGLDFKDTVNGRAFGHGVYFSREFSVSKGYSEIRRPAGSWAGSELGMSSALGLCEVINRTGEFISTEPHYVVDKVDWIQCRYLIVQRGAAPARPESKQMAFATAFVDQDPRWKAIGPNNKGVEIPTAALPKWRQHATAGGSSASNPLVVDDGECDESYDEPDDLDLMLNMQEGKGDTGQDNPNRHVNSDPEKLSFTPGTLDVTSLPQLPPPSWATDKGRKVLSREVSKLQKLQANTPLHELGWYMDFNNITNMFQWIVELHSFERSLPLAQDMERNGASSIVLEVRFGQQFPLSPPFVRVIRPRFLPFSQKGGGHVTAGGAMCMELLTNSGWSPASSMESVLLQVRMAICNLEPFPARLVSGGDSFMGDYDVGEAVMAYKRAAQAHGWQVPHDLDITARGI